MSGNANGMSTSAVPDDYAMWLKISKKAGVRPRDCNARFACLVQCGGAAHRYT